jgi:hypothetical protein
MAKKEEKPKAPKQEKAESALQKFGEFRSTLKVKAKVFEKGDEDGIMHIGGLDASKAKDESELIPFIYIGDGQQSKEMMKFKEGYLVVFPSGVSRLMEKKEFEDKFSSK